MSTLASHILKAALCLPGLTLQLSPRTYKYNKSQVSEQETKKHILAQTCLINLIYRVPINLTLVSYNSKALNITKFLFVIKILQIPIIFIFCCI